MTLTVRGIQRNVQGRYSRVVMTKYSALIGARILVPRQFTLPGSVFYDHEDRVPRGNSRHPLGTKCRRKHAAVIAGCLFMPESRS